MANKALAKRQKLMIHSEPAAKSLKPRPPFAAAAKQHAAGPHQKAASAERQLHKLLVQRLIVTGSAEGESD